MIAFAIAAAWLLHAHDAPASEAAAKSALAFAPQVPRAQYGRRLEPAENVVLHGAGQSEEESFNNYTAAVSPAKPMLTMKYVDLRDDLPAFFAQLNKDLALHHEFLVPQIGLSLNAGSAAKHYEAETAHGMDDTRIAALCAGLNALQRPVFLRVGYEFNGPWNGYEPQAYRAAFVRVAKAVHACSSSTAMVWDWSGGAEMDRQHNAANLTLARDRWSAYYPGDDAVDWWALNLFRPEEIDSPLTKAFLEAADKARFPIMIAEATPRDAGVHGGQLSVDAWFAPFFGLLRSSPGIRAFCYIDWDWAKYPQWSGWGDGRIEDNDVVMAFYRSQVVGNALYANARGHEATMKLLRVR